MLWPYVLDYYFLHSSPFVPFALWLFPSLLVTVLSWTTFWHQDWDKMPCGLRTSPFPYLLHALPSPLLYHLRVHQYLLMHDLCAPFVPTSPHHYLMYHCTINACFLPLVHVYYHAPYACLSGISTGWCSALYCRLNFLSNQVAFPSWLVSVVCRYHSWTTSLFLGKGETLCLNCLHLS